MVIDLDFADWLTFGQITKTLSASCCATSLSILSPIA